MLKDRFEALLGQILPAASQVYGSRLVSVVVFGSVARGTPRFDSDVDLLLVIRELPDGRTKRMATFEAVENQLLGDLASLAREGISTELSPLLRTPEEVLEGGLIYLDMVEDARVLLDDGEFFASFLGGLRRRLAQLGSKRIRHGNTWYWVLKPDLKPGEVFELGPLGS